MNFSKSVKKFQKKLKKGSWIHVAIVVSVVLLLVGVFWPRKKLGIRMVPVEGTTHFKAVLEHFDEGNKPKYNKIDGKVFVFFKKEGCPHCTFINKDEGNVWEKIHPGKEINVIKENKGVKFVVYDYAISNDKGVIEKQKIGSFPTMRFYSNGFDPNGFDPNESKKYKFEEYKGGRDFDSITSFLGK